MMQSIQFFWMLVKDRLMHPLSKRKNLKKPSRFLKPKKYPLIIFQLMPITGTKS